MKQLAFTILLFVVPLLGYSQAIDYQQEKQLTEVLLEDDTALDSLVEQMLRHAYGLRAVEAELVQKQIIVGQEKRSWLSTFTMGVSLYSQSTAFDEQNGSSVTTAGVLPNLGVSLSINPEKLINVPSNVKIAQRDVERTENTLREQRRTLKLFIINKYYEYLEALGIMELRLNVHQQQQEQAAQTRLRFERGETDLDAVLLVQNSLASTEEALMRAQMLVMKLKKEITLFTTDSA
jgi:outer membrane protein TolC